MRRRVRRALLLAVIGLGVIGVGLRGVTLGPEQTGNGPPPASADADFDYYLLAVSWMPGWCAIEGDAREDERCAPGTGKGWMLHGLWPQYEAGGWPEFCDTEARDPSRAQTAAMVDIMGSSGLAWHQWRKHGTCAGMSADAYFALSRLAFEALDPPAEISGTDQTRSLPPSELAEAFATALPGATPEGVAVMCRGAVIREVRLCLRSDLSPRACAPDVAERACSRRSADLLPLR